MGGDLNSSVAPVLLYRNVSPRFAGRFFFYLDLLFLPSKNVVPLCMQALSSASVTMVLLRKSSSSRSSWNYLQLWVYSCVTLGRAHPLSGLSPFVGWDGSGGSIVCRAWPWLGPLGASSGLPGTRSPPLHVRLLHRCVACYFRTRGPILGSDQPWKTRSCSSRLGTGLPAPCRTQAGC